MATHTDTIAASRKRITKRVSSGQRIVLSPQDEKTLRAAYEYVSGYAKRIRLEARVAKKEEELNAFSATLPKLPHPPRLQEARMVSMMSELTKSEDDDKYDQYYKLKEEVTRLEEKLKQHNSIDNKISLEDLEALTKRLGANLSKRSLEQMIWEVDEDVDGCISFDELQLVYFRNIGDVNANEPSSFFRILEFITFDEQRKGYIIEDDCMGMLYSRYGIFKLEKEVQAIFQGKMRALGGEGTLTLSVRRIIAHESHALACVFPYACSNLLRSTICRSF